VALLSVAAFGKDKAANLEWKTGTLIDQSADESHCSTSGTVQTGNGSVDTSYIVLMAVMLAVVLYPAVASIAWNPRPRPWTV
jgi:hypothetical protein